jgi:ectoine hydroxylase-related dioxygenase (phytanoyl-CoA dioxygenase family)
LLGEEVYLWHAKLMQKDARGGGAWVWHQDYGYWYMDACLYPDLVSCYIALDPATRQNGCLQVLKGSHRLGRLDHGPVAGQTGADPGRVALAAEELEHVYCEMAPGDGLFFHANTLHRSDRNTSDTPRWGLICCYNTKTNTPRGETFQPSYNPLRRVPDTAIKEAARAPDPTADRQFME